MAQIEFTLTEEETQGLFRGSRGVAPLLERVLNEVLEAEIADHLGAEPHERTDGRRGWRIGHYERSLTTRVGRLELRVPRDREGTFRTELFQRYPRSEKALALALMEMVVNGIATRKVRRITDELCGRDFAKSTVSDLTKGLDEQVEAWNQRPLEGSRNPLLMADAMHVKVRRQGAVRATSAHRLLGAYLAETHEEWATGRRYFRMDDYFSWKSERDGVPIREAAA